MSLERRFIDVSELRLATDGDVRTIVGYAAVFNSEAVIGDFFREKILPGAFAGVLKDDVRALINHDENLVLGRSVAGTLKLAQDDKGLRVQITPPDTQAARDLQVSMERGDVSQMSFAFSVAREGVEWDDSEKGKLPLRSIKKFRALYDVSVVTFPAYDQTVAGLRSATADLEEWRQAQRPQLISPVQQIRLGMKGRLPVPGERVAR
jgi:HK97 family phage prohead protease